MNNISQDTIFKQSVVEYSFKHGVTETTKRYKQHRKTIYRWIEKYNGTRKSLTKEIKEMNGRYYQYTAIDEYTRQRVLWASKEYNNFPLKPLNWKSPVKNI